MNIGVTITSRSHSVALAASWRWSTSSVTTCSIRAGSWPRTSASSRQRSGTTFVAVPPAIVPTFAVVSGSKRPSSIAAIARAAAAIAFRPSSGRMPGVRRAAVDDRLDPVVGRRRHHDLADRGGVVEDVAEAASQPADVELLGAAQADLLGDREQQLNADVSGGAAWSRRASTSSAATAALLSAPRIPSLALTQPPSTRTGSIGGERRDRVHVRAQQDRRPTRRPGIRVSRLPASAPTAGPAPSSSTSRPIALELELTRSAQRPLVTGRPSIAHSVANVSCSRSRSSSVARLTARRSPRGPRGRGLVPASGDGARQARGFGMRPRRRPRTRGTTAPAVRAAT